MPQKQKTPSQWGPKSSHASSFLILQSPSSFLFSYNPLETKGSQQKQKRATPKPHHSFLFPSLSRKGTNPNNKATHKYPHKYPSQCHHQTTHAHGHHHSIPEAAAAGTGRRAAAAAAGSTSAAAAAGRRRPAAAAGTGRRVGLAVVCSSCLLAAAVSWCSSRRWRRLGARRRSRLLLGMLMVVGLARSRWVVGRRGVPAGTEKKNC